MKNDTDRGFTKKRYKNKINLLNKFKGWYEDYLAHPTAQFQMTFSEYKKMRLKNKI